MRPAYLFAVVTGAVALVVGFTAAATVAHTPTVTAECDGLHVDLQRYDGSHGATNTLEVTVDGKATITNFATTYTHTFQWSTTKPHTWKATVTSIAADGSGTWSGTEQPCDTGDSQDTSTTSTSPPPPTAPNSTTSMPPSTEVPSASSAPTGTGQATSTSSVAPDDSSSTTSPAPTPPSNAPRTSKTSPKRSATELPVTGGPSPHDLLWAIVVVAIGVALILIGRRSRRRT